ncbi:MAG: hypothetical protein CMP48_09825 [Rickettsiales bacterium]|nr:hypothetical protein [Rickettsiales bacterium]
MKSVYRILFIILLIGSASCSPKIVHFTNSNSNFAQYETYGIVNYKNTKDLSTEGAEIFSFIENQVKKELSRRDYSLNPKDPDIVLRFELIANQKSDVSTTYNSPYGYYTSYPRYTVSTILQSALLLELYDVATKKLIWQASLDLDKESRKNSKEQILTNTVTKLFNTYLYRAKTNSTDQSLISE